MQQGRNAMPKRQESKKEYSRTSILSGLSLKWRYNTFAISFIYTIYHLMEGDPGPDQPMNANVVRLRTYEEVSQRVEYLTSQLINAHARIAKMEERLVQVLQTVRGKFRELEPTADNDLAFCCWLDKFLSRVISIAESLGSTIRNGQAKAAPFVSLRAKNQEMIKKLEQEIARNKDWHERQAVYRSQLEKIRMLDIQEQELQEKIDTLNEKIENILDSVRVYCRLRPSTTEKEAITVKDCFTIQVVTLKRALSKPKYKYVPRTSRQMKKSGVIVERKKATKKIVKSVVQPKPEPVINDKPLQYQFDHILSSKVSQQECFSGFEYLIDHMLLGGISVLFAYGIAGSGKTYSLLGANNQWKTNSTALTERSGIIPRALHFIFSVLKQAEEELGLKYTVHMQFLEIYQEDKETETNKYAYNYKSIRDPKEPIRSAEEGIALLLKRLQTKKVSKTPNNQFSSRSHFFVSIYYECLYRNSEINGELVMCDLAGNERLDDFKSEEQGKRAKSEETLFINNTLFDVTTILRQIKKKQKTKRDTRFDHQISSLICRPHTKIAVLLTLNPDQDQVARSKSTLQFAKDLNQDPSL